MSVPDEVVETGGDFLRSVWPDPPTEPELAFLPEADVVELRLRQVAVCFDRYVAVLEEWLRDEDADGGTS